MTLKDEADARRRFGLLIRTARTEHFEKGSFDEEPILTDVIAADEKLWNSLQPVFARDAALEMVRRVVKGTPMAYDWPQPKLFEDLPSRIATSRGGWKAVNKATLADLRWHVKWYELRLQGNVKRTTRDTEILAKFKRLLKLVERHSANDEATTVEIALRRD